MTLKEKQKEILAQFYSNFALAWLTFGVINPVFNPPDKWVKIFMSFIVGVAAGGFFLRMSLKFLK